MVYNTQVPPDECRPLRECILDTILNGLARRAPGTKQTFDAMNEEDGGFWPCCLVTAPYGHTVIMDSGTLHSGHSNTEKPAPALSHTADVSCMTGMLDPEKPAPALSYTAEASRRSGMLEPVHGTGWILGAHAYSIGHVDAFQVASDKTLAPHKDFILWASLAQRLYFTDTEFEEHLEQQYGLLLKLPSKKRKKGTGT